MAPHSFPFVCHVGEMSKVRATNDSERELSIFIFFAFFQYEVGAHDYF